MSNGKFWYPVTWKPFSKYSPQVSQWICSYSWYSVLNVLHFVAVEFYQYIRKLLLCGDCLSTPLECCRCAPIPPPQQLLGQTIEYSCNFLSQFIIGRGQICASIFSLQFGALIPQVFFYKWTSHYLHQCAWQYL